jgi:hypothetical protein
VCLGDKIKEYWRKCGPERPAAVLKDCQHNQQFEQAKSQQIYSRKSMTIDSETYVKTLQRLTEQINRIC